MFEAALLESAGSIRTGTRWTAIFSASAQAVAVAVVIALPLLHPLVLRSTPVNLTLLDPPRSAPHAEHAKPAVASAHASAESNALEYRPRTESAPAHAAQETDIAPDTGMADLGPLAADKPGVAFALLSTGETRPMIEPRPPRSPANSAPLRISSGVAAGTRIAGAAPVYPQLARATRTSGHVIIEAVISPSGSVQDEHVVSGPAMLRQAALDAVATYRYRPFLLNGEAVAASFTVDVNFTLGQ